MSEILWALLVEDSEDDALLVLRELQRGGLAVESLRVDTEPDFLAAIGAQPWDIILSDFSMPEFNGMAAFALLTEQGLDIPFIFVSGRIGEDRAAEAMRLGAKDYVLKDDLRRLVPAVMRELKETGERRKRQAIADALRASDEKLRANERLLQTVFDTLPVHLVVKDAQTRYLKVNRAWCERYGLTPEQVIGKTSLEIPGRPEADKQSTLDQDRQTLASGGDTVVIEGWDTVATGELRHFRTVRKALTDDSGRVTGLVGATLDLTDLKRAEEQLRASEERLRALIEGAKDYAIYMLDPAGNVVTWNSGAERMMGYTAEEAIGRNFARFYPPEEVAGGHPERDLRAAAEQGRIADEGWRVRKDGSRFWGNGVLSLLSNGKQVRGFAKVVRDLTDRHRSEALLRSVLDNTVVTVVSIDARGIVQSFNRAGEQLFGYSASEVIGQNVKILMPEPYRSGHDGYVADYLRTGQAKVIGIGREITARRKDGSVFAASLFVAEFPLDGERHFTGIIQDITERKQAEEARRESEERLRLIMEHSPIGIIVNDADFRYTYWNPAAERIFGYSLAEVLGRQPKEIVVPPDTQGALDNLFQRFSRGETEVHEETVANRTKNGQRITCEWRHSALYDKRGRFLGKVSMVQDITERAQAAQELAAQEFFLRQAQEAGGVGVWQCDAQTRETTWTEQTYRIFGLDPLKEPLSFDKFLAAVHPDDREQSRRVREQAMREGGGFRDQFRIVRPDGAIRTLEERGEVIKDRTGAPLLMAGTTQDVTQRIQAAQELAAQEFFLRQAQAAGGVGVWQRNLASGEIVWSEQTYRIFGLPPDQGAVTSERLFAAIHPDDREKFISVRQQAEAAQSPFDDEFRVVWPNGEVRHVASKAEVIREPSGAVMMRGTIQDVTQRKAAEESLRASEARIRGIVETIPHGIQECDLHGVITYSNRAHTELLGYANRELIGKTVWSLVASPAEQKALQEYLQYLVEKQPAPAPYHSVDVTKDGRRIDVQVDWDYVRDAQGRLTGFISIITDTTERRRAETQLRESEERYRSLVEGSTQGILITQDGQIVFCNQEIARRVANGDTATLLGTTGIDVVVPEDRERVAAVRRALLAGEAVTLPVEYGVVGSNGEKISVQAYSQRILWNGRPAIQSTLMDVTSTRQLEQQLAQSQRLETVGRLAGGIAHDFNNLLTVISAYIGFILDRATDNAQLREDATVVQDASRRAAALTHQLLAFSRRQILQMRVINLNDVVTGMHTMLGRLIGEDIEVRNVLDPALKPIRADAGQIDQVIMNLVINARDAMPHGGVISIETANQSLDEHYAHTHTDVAPGEYVMLAITDNGTGMSPETQKRIFEPFFTTKPQGQGTGLGLATVYGIVKQMNGSIFVYSEVNKGTTFKIYFPVAQDAAINGAPDSAKPPAVQPTETVLLVEDDELVRRSAQRILQGGGYRVIVAASPDAALAIAQAGDPPFDLLLTDVVMPGLSGGELWETIRKVRDVRVLFMSGYTDDMIVRHVVLEGEMPFISKPFTKQSLLDKVREVFEKAH